MPPDVERTRRPDATAQRGRGLQLAAPICADVVIDSSPAGTTVILATNLTTQG
jgi:hypothetical protein